MRRVAICAAIFGALGLTVALSLPASGKVQLDIGRSGPAASTAKAPKNRYALVHGCYYVRTAGQRLGPFRMQAAALGQYLLYGVQGNYLGPGLQMTSTPSVWIVNGKRRHFRMANTAGGSAVPVKFVRASGCAVYPEAQVGAFGKTFKGRTAEGLVNGTIDAHVHVTGFELFGGEWHCGKPWDAWGAPFALPDCKSVQQGTNGEVESFLDYGAPSHPHDTVGWPTFHDWPSPTDLAEEGTYYTGIKRAWMAGLRVMVTQLVDNEALCMLMSQRKNPCNDMASVHIQAADLHALQDYIDAQSGGPGKGFFRIVTNPFQARQVINQGKLAVVEGIEVSHIFNCGELLGVPQCNQAQVDAGLKEVRALGVSTFFPVHKFDNAFGGTKMDGGETGVIVNQGNKYETGHYWNIQTCTGPEHDSEQLTSPAIGGLAQLLNGPVAQTFGGGSVPAYPPPPHCNTRGLTPIGTYLLDKMIQQHFIVELDHMDAKTADSALSVLEAHHYSGVISAHSWDSPEENPRVYNLGGFVTPIAGTPQDEISAWKDDAKIRNTKYYGGAGFGYGADMNGLHAEGGPTNAQPISYPFKSYDGRVTFNHEVWGQRVWDINKDGVANYGLFPDWFEGVRQLGGNAIMADMFKGAEAYLEMWERAFGVPGPGCVKRGARVKRGTSWQNVLYALGQPSSRPGSKFRYCVIGGGRLTVTFNRRGRVARVRRV